MSALELTAGVECVANDRVYQIDCVSSSSTVLARDKASGEMATLRISQLQPMPRPTRSAHVELSRISDRDWNRASLLATAFGRLSTRRAPIANLERIAAAAGVSVRHVQRLRRLYRRDPGVSVLAPDRSRGTRVSRLDPKVDEVIQRVIRRYYLKRERPPMSEILRRVHVMCRRAHLQEPSRKAVEARIGRINAVDRDRARLGAKAANQIHQARPGRMNITRPLEMVQIDHTRVDLMVVSDDRLTVLGRPWISLAIDIATRCVMGMYLSMDAPAAESVSLCIDHMVLPKSENEGEGNDDLWPMYGKPECIHVDNGKDFRSQALSRGCQEFGIRLMFRPVRTPHFGAYIERYNGTLMRHCHLLSGTTFSNIRQKDKYDSEAKAVYTLEELRAYLVQRICRVYHCERHRELGVSPLVAWERAWTNADGQPVLPALVSDPLDFRMHFLPLVSRTVSSSGIAFENSKYYTEELASLIGGEPIDVRYDRRMPGSVWVRQRDGRILEVPATRGEAAGQTKLPAMDAPTVARMKARIDAAYEATDTLDANAHKATRRARRHAGQPAPAPEALLAALQQQAAYLPQLQLDLDSLPLDAERIG